MYIFTFELLPTVVYPYLNIFMAKRELWTVVVSQHIILTYFMGNNQKKESHDLPFKLAKSKLAFILFLILQFTV